MERVFTKNVGRNYQAGDVKDLPLGTWRHIAKNLKAKDLSDFSKPVNEAIQDSIKRK